MKAEKRDSNFELLRIILILMVLVLHYNNAGMGGGLSNVIPNSFNYYFVNFTESYCIIAVNVFVLITGYFMINKDTVKISKIIKLFLLAILYNTIFYILVVAKGKIDFNFSSINSLLKNMTSIWFIVIYSILYLLIPYINKMVKNINKKQYTILLFILLFFFSIWPTYWTTTPCKDFGYGIINFILLYLIGGYIKLYKDSYKNMLLFFSINIIGVLIVFYQSLHYNYALFYNNPFNIINAVSFFLIFKSIKLKHNKIINYAASFTFPIYIIHCNIYIGKTLYQTIFHSYKYYYSKYIVVNTLVAIIGVYIICFTIELLRRIIMKRFFDSKIENISLSLD